MDSDRAPRCGPDVSRWAFTVAVTATVQLELEVLVAQPGGGKHWQPCQCDPGLPTVGSASFE